MSIKFSCPSCAKTYDVDDKFSGKSTKCVKCGEKIKVPLMAGGLVFEDVDEPKPSRSKKIDSQIEEDTGDVTTKRVTAGILGILFGVFGLQRFVAGQPVFGLILLTISLGSWAVAIQTDIVGIGYLGSAAVSMFGFIDGIVMLFLSDKAFARKYLKKAKP